MVYYAVQRYLRLSPQEWDNLSWQWQRTYLEGLAVDGKLEGAFDDESPDADDLEEAGFTVNRIVADAESNGDT